MKNITKKEIKKLQTNLALIRKIAGWSTSELGDLIGVTKQTINNLENKKTDMTKTQYIAIRAVLDYTIAEKKDTEALAKTISVLLDTDNLSDEEQEKVEDTMAFVSGAVDRGVNTDTILTGMKAILGALGAAAVIGAVTASTNSIHPWMSKINQEEQND